MKGFVANIEDRTKANRAFRRVVYTGENMQLVLMTLPAGEEIGEEVHETTDQFFRVEEGEGELWMDGEKVLIGSEFAILVPAGSRHNIKNTGRKSLKLYTLYAPPQHADGTVHQTRAEAELAEKHAVS